MMMATEVWVQPSLFPEFLQTVHAYEIEAIGGRWWEIFDDSGFLEGIEPEDFGDFLDFMRSINYDVRINTYDSWIAMEEWG
jgi:hypothetical protein